MPKTLLGHHLVFGCYGFWLRNDPRGSWSTFVGGNRLYAHFGPATTVATRTSRTSLEHDEDQRGAAKEFLNHPVAKFDGVQAREVALAIRDVAAEIGLTIWACAIMPDHMHLVVCPHRIAPGRLIGRFRYEASKRLHDAKLWSKEHPVWAKGKWAGRLVTEDEVRARIVYVERNPVEAGLPVQRWSFVEVFLA